ncbi:MAG: protein kinase [Sorangiineae bacterium]|nr:protein kinase [Polyangiaceae bacterium]MEB2322043.1 protein kinase [Sorangiineae bacterium]
MLVVEKASPPPAAGAAVLFGPFVLERRVAVGGSAEVFIARPKLGERPARQFVVKRLLPSYRDSGELDLLEREAELHRAVAHENVVTVYGAGMVGEEPYLAMEYVEGLDLHRLLRRAEAEARALPVGLAVFIARRVLAALGAVHRARDPEGNPLHIVHRDVTPSNVYLSIDGAVKLGDFGIARARKGPVRGAAAPSAGLKGKFGYLAPEQIASEPFDHRADLFSLAAVLGELVIGKRVFPGEGQLAVLLAIRDVNIDPLRAAAPRLPPGLFGVLERALARDPASRFDDAEAFARALEPFEQPSASELGRTLAEWVSWARDSSALEGRLRDSVQRLRAVRSAAARRADGSSAPPSRASAGVAIRCKDGRKYLAVPLPRLIEMITSGDLGADDELSLTGGDFQPLGSMRELSEYLVPSSAMTTSRLFEPGTPDFRAALGDTGMLEVLARMRARAESGAMFIERRDRSGVLRRKELYVREGRLHHVASTDPAERLGEYLLRRGAIAREELERALATLEAHGGRLGDTLVELGLVDAVEVFRAIRDQGRDRVAALCGWTRGNVSFYRTPHSPHVEFPLDLDLASPMMAGVFVLGKGDPCAMLPADSTRLRPGARAAAARERVERGTSPISLQLVATLLGESMTVAEALEQLVTPRAEAPGRPIGRKEAGAALVTARALGWVAFD